MKTCSNVDLSINTEITRQLKKASPSVCVYTYSIHNSVLTFFFFNIFRMIYENNKEISNKINLSKNRTFICCETIKLLAFKRQLLMSLGETPWREEGEMF